MMIGAALWNAQQTGLERLQAVREKLADLVCYREGINAHLVAAIAEAQRSPGGLLMPHQSLLYAGRVHACANLPQMMHITRELCGGQICVTPNAAAFEASGTRDWLEKFYSLNDNWRAEDRRKLLAFCARPAHLGLRRPPPYFRSVCPGAAFQPPQRGLQLV
jgi:4-hydroxyphenylacetate 3-monooxygenase